MLELKNIVKDYDIADDKVHALKGINITFRRNEFVAILGPSGCGKTTLLNIIGGLDKYTDGDLVIEGRSTKEYKDRDWDTYRNHSVGFIFQSYHLIPHQTILQNVELALTISGVPKKERKERAIAALEKVGLGDRINNKPNQLSGGQAQRVAIARALINDPEIVLADEPTGALDSKTSVQIMELLKEVAKDRLVIMVTHNPPLAERYATRIIKLLDGEMTEDSMPYAEDEVFDMAEQGADRPVKFKGNKKNASMSMGMAMGLSFRNLLSKGKRTVLVSFAGSIGIIGVSLVLAISSGVQNYITDMENDMLSGYPVSVSQTALDFSSIQNMSTAMGERPDLSQLKDKLYVNSLLKTLSSFTSTVTMNNISDAYVSYVTAMPEEYYNVLQYGYGFDMANNIYTDFRVEGSSIGNRGDMEPNSDYADGTLSVTAIRQMYSSVLGEVEEYASLSSLISTMGTFSEILDNPDYIMSQYDVVAIDDGNGGVSTSKYTDEQIKDIFNSEDSLIMVVSNSAVTDLTMAQFGYFTEDEFLNYAFHFMDEGNSLYDEEMGLMGEASQGGLDYSYFIGDSAKKFTWYSNDSIYTETGNTASPFVYKSSVEGGEYKYSMSQNGIDLGTFTATVAPIERDEDTVDMSVKLILQKKDSVSYGMLDSGLYYTHALTEHMLDTAENSNVVKYIEEQENKILSSMPYYYTYTYIKDGQYVNGQTMYVLVNSGSSSMMSAMMGTGDSSEMMQITTSFMGGDRLPVSMYIYPVDFDHKVLITDYLDGWNTMCETEGGYTYTYVSVLDGNTYSVDLGEDDSITYTDTVGLIIGLVNTMIRMVTIALVCFTALSLVVSTVMIGIITYVSVVERIKEIGILRAVGARKKDIKRLFNAETFMIGLVAGVIGIAVTYILSLIINVIVGALVGVYTIASLPIWQAVIMVAVSVILTLISGLIPASSAAKKDPVVALRTE